MSAPTVSSPRVREVEVLIECPTWCESSHDGGPASGLGDVWHRRELARGEGEDTCVDLVLSELDLAANGNSTPEISVMLDGDFLELAHRERWTSEHLRRLAALCSTAAAALESMGSDL